MAEITEALARRLRLLGYTLEARGLRGWELLDAQNHCITTAPTLEVLDHFIRDEEARRPWHKVQISRDNMQLGAFQNLTSRYSKMWVEAGGPVSAATYSGPFKAGSLTVFFSPKASELAPALLREYDAQPCEQPTGVSMLVGDQADRLAF